MGRGIRDQQQVLIAHRGDDLEEENRQPGAGERKERQQRTENQEPEENAKSFHRRLLA
jgi:hypothetical protein